MKNTLTENKLVELAEYKLKDTLLNLIYDLAENPASKAEYIIPDFIFSIKEKVEKAYSELENVFETTDRSSFDSQLSSISSEIIACAVNINKYAAYNEQLGEKLFRAYKLNDIKSADYNNIPLNNNGVSDVVKGYVTSLPDNFESTFSMAELISVFPLRMTKDRFNDYVSKGFEIISKGIADEFAASCVERLKDMFYADCNDSFKADFPLMYEKLKSTEESLNELDKDSLFEALNDIDGNAEAIQNIFSLLGIYFNDVTYMQTLSMFAVDTEFLYNNDMVLKDLYYSLRNVITSGDTLLSEEILDRAGNEIEDRFELLQPIENEISKAIENMTDKEYDNLSDEIKLSINVNNEISKMFYNELENQLMFSMGKNIKREEMADELINYIYEKTEKLPNADKKFLKQSFLKNIPCPMTKQELIDYCIYSLDGINNRELSLLTYGEIFSITDKNDGTDEHEHHHDHGCGCGHEHHHDHGCDCGHEHHHDHGCDCGHEHHHHDHDCNCKH